MWLAFVLGQMLNIVRQAKLVAGCKPEKNPIRSALVWIRRNLVGLIIREGLSLAAWALVVYTPVGIYLIHTFAGQQWVPGEPLAVVLGRVPVVAFPFGIILSLAFDYLIEKWPWLKAKIPALT